jgi:hypothetical protein
MIILNYPLSIIHLSELRKRYRYAVIGGSQIADDVVADRVRNAPDTAVTQAEYNHTRVIAPPTARIARSLKFGFFECHI